MVRGEGGFAAAPLSEASDELLLALLVLRWRGPLGCAAWPFSLGDAVLDVVAADHLFRFAMPSRRLPIPSTWAVAEERRREGGGVALLWGMDGSGIVVSLSEADRPIFAVTDEEMELLREDWRVWAGAARSGGGPAASGV